MVGSVTRADGDARVLNEAAARRSGCAGCTLSPPSLPARGGKWRDIRESPLSHVVALMKDT